MTNAPLIGFHDAEVTGIYHDSKRAELILRCRFTGSRVQQLVVFVGVKAWRLSEFDSQNVVFTLTATDGKTWLNSEEGREEYFQEVAATVGQHDVVYSIESSVGMDGCIVATGYRLEQVLQ